MLTSLLAEHIVLLTFTAIDALLLALCLFILLNTSRSTLRGGVRLFSTIYRTSTFTCLLAATILAIIATLQLRDQLLGIDDDPPPLELGASTIPDLSTSLVNITDILVD